MSTTPVDPPAITFQSTDTMLSIITQGLCLAGVYWGSRHALKNWIAVSALTPPPLPADTPPPLPADTPPPLRQGWKRIFNKENIRFLPFILILVFYFFIFVVVPRIKAKWVLDAFWVLLMSFPIWVAYYIMLGTVISATHTAAYKTNELDGKYTRSIIYTADKAVFNQCLSVTMTIGTIVGCAYGYGIGLAAATGSFTLLLIAVPGLPKLTTRHTILVLNGYIIFVVLLTLMCAGIILLIMALVGTKDGAAENQPNNEQPFPVPSPWVNQIMLLSSQGMPTAAPGFLLALALRYDYSRTIELGYKALPGQAVVAPKGLVSFARPTFNAGFISLTLCVTVWSIAKAYMQVSPSFADMCLVFFSIPVTTIGFALSAWCRGQLRDWWMYSETWVPTGNDTASSKASTTDAENRLSGDVAVVVESEKPLPTVST